MITTSEIAPSPALAPYVRCYSFREFDTHNTNLTKAWHASHETTMPFFFKALPVKLVDTETGNILKTGNSYGISGLSTQYNGEMTFNGHYAWFEIIFKPNGFCKIFNIPTGKIVNQIIDGDEIFDRGIKLFFEQLCNAKGLMEMGKLADAYLLYYLHKRKSVNDKDKISLTICTIIKNGGLVNIDALAYSANMSIRNFERLFITEMAMSPKLFSCITRFNHALNLKLKYPGMHWTSIAHQSGYFDQMHLIKDFKKFSGAAPNLFIDNAPMTREKYESRVEVY
jgi:AraC-like DNA-binding protein